MPVFGGLSNKSEEREMVYKVKLIELVEPRGRNIYPRGSGRHGDRQSPSVMLY